MGISENERPPVFDIEIKGASSRQQEAIIKGLLSAYHQQLCFFEKVPDRFVVTVCPDEASWEAEVDADHGHALAINRGSHLILRSDESEDMIGRFPELALTGIGAFAGHEFSHSCWRLLPNGSRWTPYWLCEGVAAVYNQLPHYPALERAIELWRGRFATDKRLLAFDYRVGILEEIDLRSAAYRIWGQVVGEMLAVATVTPRELVLGLSNAASMQEAEKKLKRYCGQTLQGQIEVLLSGWKDDSATLA